MGEDILATNSSFDPIHQEEPSPTITSKIPHPPTELWPQIYRYAATDWLLSLRGSGACYTHLHHPWCYAALLHGTTWRLPKPEKPKQEPELPMRIKLKLHRLPAAFWACSLSRIVFYDALKECAIKMYGTAMETNMWITRYNVPGAKGGGERVLVPTLPEALRAKNWLGITYCGRTKKWIVLKDFHPPDKQCARQLLWRSREGQCLLVGGSVVQVEHMTRTKVYGA